MKSEARVLLIALNIYEFLAHVCQDDWQLSVDQLRVSVTAWSSVAQQVEPLGDMEESSL